MQVGEREMARESATTGGGQWRVGSIRIETQLHTETLTSSKPQPYPTRVREREREREREETSVVGGGSGGIEGGWLGWYELSIRIGWTVAG